MSRYGVWLLAVLAVTITALSPALREALIDIEPLIAPALFTLGLVGSRLRGAEATAARFLSVWGWPLALLAFLAPLLSQWFRGPIGASAAFSALLGYIPFGDAHGHFEGVSRLLNDGQLNGFSERRPLNATWLVNPLAFGGGRLAVALVIQTLLLAVSALWAARVVSIRFGVFPSLAFFGLVQGFFRMFVVGVLTEPLSASFACLALAVLLPQIARSSLSGLVVGFLLLDAALRTRPGAQFLLPCLVVWAVLLMRGWRARTAVALAGVFVAGALHTGLLNRLYGSGEASATSYPAFTLYGLTRDSNYEQAWSDFDTPLKRLPDEDARARFLYARSLERLRSDPRPFLHALARNEREFLGKLSRELVRLVSIGRFADSRTRYLSPTETEWRRDWILGGAALLIVLVGFGLHLARCRTTERVFWLTVFTGMATSAAFVFGDTGLRAMTAGLPFVAAAVAAGLGGARRRPAMHGGLRLESRAARFSVGSGFALLVASLVGPAAVRAVSRAPDPSHLQGLTPSHQAVVDLATCPAVLVSNRGASSLELPLIDTTELDRQLNLAGLRADAGLRQVRSPFVVGSCYNRLSGRQLLLVLPHGLFKQPAGWYRLDLQPLSGDERFQEVVSSSPLP